MPCERICLGSFFFKCHSPSSQLFFFTGCKEEIIPCRCMEPALFPSLVFWHPHLPGRQFVKLLLVDTQLVSDLCPFRMMLPGMFLRGSKRPWVMKSCQWNVGPEGTWGWKCDRCLQRVRVGGCFKDRPGSAPSSDLWIRNSGGARAPVAFLNHRSRIGRTPN